MSNRFFDVRLLQEARRPRGWLGLAVVLGLVAGVLLVLQASLLVRSIAGVFLGGRTLADVRPYLLTFGLVAGLRALAVWGSDLSAQRVALAVKTALRDRLIARIAQLGPAYTRGERTGELTNAVVEGVEALDSYFSKYLPQLMLGAFIPLTIVLFVLPRDPLSGVVLILTAPLIPIFMVLIGDRADALTRKQWGALSRMSAHFLDMIQGLPTLKLFNRSREQIREIAAVSERYRDTTLGVLRVAFLSSLVLELVTTLSTAVIAVEIGLRLLYGRMSFEQALFVLVLAPEFYLPLRTLGARFHSAISAITAARRIFTILEKEPASATTPGDAPAATPMDATLTASPLISLQGVTYRYGEDNIPAVADVSIDIRPGTTLALVGPTGGGKTTLTQLLLRFIEPSTGEIFVDGRPLSSIDPDAWRAQIAWVPQAPYLFHASVVDNIRMGRPGASEDEVLRAAGAAGVDRFVGALADGYDTMIGERGARLSGGQAQRVALARALLRDAPIVILDEATSSLDPISEAEFMEVFDRLVRGRTAIVVAHRLNTIEKSDAIAVIEAGRVVEIGTHEELLQRSGAYSSLVEVAGVTLASGMSRKIKTKLDREQPVPTSRAAPIAEPAVAPATSETSTEPVLSTVQTIRRLLALLRPFWVWIALSVLLGFLTVGSGMGLMATSAWIIASAALHPSIAALQVAIVGVRFFGLSRGLARYAERLVSHRVTFDVLTRLRVAFYGAIEPLAPAGLAAFRSGDLLSRVTSGVATLEDFYIRAVAPPIVALLTALLGAALTWRLDPRLAPTYLLGLGGAGVLVPLLTGVLGRGNGRRLVAARSELDAASVDGIQGLADLLTLGAAPRYRQRLTALGKRLSHLQWRAGVVSAFEAALLTISTHWTVAAVLWVAIPLVTGGSLPAVELSVLALLVAASFEAVMPLPAAAHQMGRSLAAGRALFGIAASSEEGEALASPERSDAPELLAGAPLLEFSNVGFRYSGGDPWALRDVSFRVDAGQKIAVVGLSGAGKSTLVNLLVAFWSPESGIIRVRGRDVASTHPERIRDDLAVVPQRCHLFNATIRDNLVLARPGASQEQIEKATRAAQIHDFIVALPAGYGTWIGEGGARLSGGERQRLAIARALLRDTPLLVLDEPTANLDAVTERSIFATLAGALSGRTALIISHRLAGLRWVDQILVMDGGRIVQRGRHAELLAQDGPYRRLWWAESDGLY